MISSYINIFIPRRRRESEAEKLAHYRLGAEGVRQYVEQVCRLGLVVCPALHKMPSGFPDLLVILKMPQVQGRALLTTKSNPNEAGGLKGILGRFFARRQVLCPHKDLISHLSFHSYPDDFGNANLAGDWQDRAPCSI